MRTKMLFCQFRRAAEILQRSHVDSTVNPSLKSPHAQWYDDVVPAMIPVVLLGSAIYLGLQLTQLNLSHEKYMQGAKEQVRKLEEEIYALQKQQQLQQCMTPEPKKTSWLWPK
ncbi:hypothetical protein C8J56DRAFT_557798 [Mycena floridula]|nr:hypothetical protein C8J56DRAFT_557798 [Mycena floridula]